MLLLIITIIIIKLYSIHEAVTVKHTSPCLSFINFTSKLAPFFLLLISFCEVYGLGVDSMYSIISLATSSGTSFQSSIYVRVHRKICRDILRFISLICLRKKILKVLRLFVSLHYKYSKRGKGMGNLNYCQYLMYM